ncbi:MAG: carboxymuconolactone decarboxylase family protein [Flavipsychrobacter sp.]|nr:carboxymuconolactone decarboxylase family protein [Flavipsychrobacter sp.]
MAKRINFSETAPAAFKAMLGLETYLATTALTTRHKDLIKIRASQTNGCAYCIDMHTRDARKAGETEQRIYTLNAWRETTFFTEDERAILALTEEVTLIQNHVSDDTYHNALTLLGELYLAEVLMAITIINAWNRIGIATQMMPPVS